jgi:hypothetical protein
MKPPATRVGRDVTKEFEQMISVFVTTESPENDVDVGEAEKIWRPKWI